MAKRYTQFTRTEKGSLAFRKTGRLAVGKGYEVRGKRVYKDGRLAGYIGKPTTKAQRVALERAAARPMAEATRAQDIAEQTVAALRQPGGGGWTDIGDDAWERGIRNAVRRLQGAIRLGMGEDVATEQLRRLMEDPSKETIADVHRALDAYDPGELGYPYGQEGLDDLADALLDIESEAEAGYELPGQSARQTRWEDWRWLGTRTRPARGPSTCATP